MDWQRKASPLTHRQRWNKSQWTCGEAFQSIAVVLAGWVWCIRIIGTDWPCFLAVYSSLHCFDERFFNYYFIEISFYVLREFISERKGYETAESSIYYTASGYKNKEETLQTETSDDIPTSSCTNGGAGTQCDFNNMSLDFNDRKTLCGL